MKESGKSGVIFFVCVFRCPSGLVHLLEEDLVHWERVLPRLRVPSASVFEDRSSN